MKKSTIHLMLMLFITLTLQAIAQSLWAQVPQKMSYQAVIRNSSDKLVVNQKVGMRISILKDSETGSSVYTETQKPTTNANGLATLEIGAGTTSDNFSAIDWASGPYYIKTETDPTGGTSYTINGVSQLLSVPYALFAKNVENDMVDDADADPSNEIQVLSKSGNMVTLSKSEGSVSVDDADADPANEIQTISKTGNTVTLSKNGGTFTDAVDDADADPVNEIQTLSLVGSNLTLSKNGGAVTLPIAEGGDNWGIQTAVTNATLEGNGLIATPLKIAQQGATTGQVLKWNGTNWLPGTDIASGSAAGGDLGGTYPNPTVTKIQGVNIHNTAPTTGQILSYNGINWAPTAISTGLTLPFGVDSSYSTTPFSIENTGSSWTTIQGISTNGSGVFGRTRAFNGAGVYGIATGSDYSSGVMGHTGEGATSGLPGNVGVLGQSKANLGVAGTSISGTGGYFSSSTGFALHTIGKVKLTGIGELFGNVLTCNEIGEATWQPLPASTTYWQHSTSGIYYNTGKVGIGTPTPTSLLEIDGIASTSELHMVNNATGRTSNDGLNIGYGIKAFLWNYENTDLAFGTNDTQQMIIKSNGNIGVGTSSPTSKFEIDGNSDASTIHLVTNSSGKTSGDGLKIGSSSFAYMWNYENDDLFFGTNNYERLTIKGNGNIGIGTTSPTRLLDVAGSIGINKGVASGGALYCYGDEAIWYNDTYFSWGFGGTYNYFDDEVTIGTSATPGYKLVVNGTAAKTGGGSWSNLSDIRLKNLNGNYHKGLKEIVALQPITFTYKEGNPRELATDEEQIGFVAQEVQKVFPEAVKECSDGYLDFNMHAINVALVNAVKELKVENDQLRAENELLKSRNDQIESRLTNLEKTIGTSAMK